MADNAEIWVLLWSQRQNCLHVEPETLMFARNRDKFAGDRQGDYVTMFAGTRTEIDAAADALRRTIADRDVRRATQRDATNHLAVM